MDLDREWSQEELRAYLLENGWKPEDLKEGEIIPQGVKFISFEPSTAADIPAPSKSLRSIQSRLHLLIRSRIN